MSRDKNFDGSYATSRYAKKSLEEDINRFAEKGILVGETSTGGLYKESDTKIDVWGKGEVGGPYPHYYYSSSDDYGKAPDDRFDK